jgi:periplasmic divalent cation tolerance protein
VGWELGLGLAGFKPFGGGRMNTDRAVFVYTTYPSIVEAEEAGRALVEQRLCACVNILPGMVSYYWWQGAVERGEEAVMIVKTRAELSERVATAIKGMHSYAVPAIIVIPLESVDQPYLEWLMAETEAAAGQG